MLGSHMEMVTVYRLVDELGSQSALRTKRSEGRHPGEKAQRVRCGERGDRVCCTENKQIFACSLLETTRYLFSCISLDWNIQGRAVLHPFFLSVCLSGPWYPHLPIFLSV